ncbi:MAG: phospholipase D-like domain-containing protein [Candidatus Aenigmatarchaeota archaeon]
MEIYFDKSVGNILKKYFESSKEIIIVSTYLSSKLSEYIKELSKNKKILLITSNDKSFYHQRALKNLQKIKVKYVYFLFFLILSFLFLIASFSNLLFSVFFVMFLLLLLKYGFKYEFIIPTIIFEKDRFIHAKIYIFDRKILFFSSANMTYNGFYQNYEFLIKTNDSKHIEEIIKKLENILKIKINML